jgi:hypothetical protein
VRFHVDSFALTSNNVTYARSAIDELLGLLPTGDQVTGCIPVWGFADVIESRCESIAVGERYLRLLADCVTRRYCTAFNAKASGFIDGAAHRARAACGYNQYTTLQQRSGYVARRKHSRRCCGHSSSPRSLIGRIPGRQRFLRRASRHLSARPARRHTAPRSALHSGEGPRRSAVIGLNSPGNLAFSPRGLGCYDRGLNYDELTTLPASTPVVYVDFSGKLRALRARSTATGRTSCATAARLVARTGRARRRQGPRRPAPGACSSRRHR